MNLTAIHAATPSLKAHPPVALEKLSGNARLSEPQKISEASRQFEAVLLRQILQEARKPICQTPLTNSSTTTALYQDMITSQLAENISQSGTFGLAQSLQGQLNHQVLGPKGTTPGQDSTHPAHD